MASKIAKRGPPPVTLFVGSMVARLLLLALGAASAFRCPPVEEGQALKQAGEACGGACRALGECAEGLKCIVPKSSGMSFALLLAPERGGVCTKPEALAVEGRKLGDARELVGSAIDFDLMADKEGLAALRFGVATIAAISEREEGSKADKLELVGVIRSTKQVVVSTALRPIRPLPLPSLRLSHSHCSPPSLHLAGGHQIQGVGGAQRSPHSLL